MAVVLGGALLPFFSQPDQLRAGLALFANPLPNARNSDVSCLNKEEIPPAPGQALGEKADLARPPFKSGPEVSDPIGIAISTITDASQNVPGSSDVGVPPTSSSHLDTEVQRGISSRLTIDWSFDKPGGKSVLALSDFGNGMVVTGLSFEGVNMSDLPLTEIRAIVKPDKGPDFIELVLSVPGQSSRGGSVAPGTPFSLIYKLPKHPKGVAINAFLAQIGGMLFTFKYTLGGREKTLITYLPEAVIRGSV